MKSAMLISSVFALGVGLAHAQQTDDPGQSEANPNTNPLPNGGQGTVIQTFAPATTGGTPVGLEDDGAGNLLITDIGDDLISTISSVDGSLISAGFAGTGNPIGVTTDGTNIYHTDTTADAVFVFDLVGNPQGSFSVAAETTFPEGITFSPVDGNLYVVNGSGGNMVHQYSTTGTLLNSFPILGSSPDGIAWDPLRSVFWIYDSGTDTVRSYDTAFNVVDSFPGTIANGFAGGEGLAVIGDSLFVVATGSNLVVEFGLTPTAADLSITKTAAAPTPLVVGSAVTFTLAVNNAGAGNADGIVVTDSLPANVTYVSNTCGAGFAAPVVTWNVGSLANGASATCDIATTVSDFGPISNTASVMASTADPNAANNSSTVDLGGVPFPADVSVALTSDAPMGAIGVGTQFNYTVVGSNAGPGVANDLMFTLTLSNKVSFVSSSCGAVAAGNSVTWTVATLASGASTSCAITVAVVAPGDLLATVNVTTSTDDPNLVNNVAELVVGFVATQVPTLGNLALLLLALLMAGATVVVIRR